jgi:hypothetical protein
MLSEPSPEFQQAAYLVKAYLQLNDPASQEQRQDRPDCPTAACSTRTSALAGHGGGQLAATGKDLHQWKIRGSGVALEPFSRRRFTGTHAIRNGQAGFNRQREQNEM